MSAVAEEQLDVPEFDWEDFIAVDLPEDIRRQAREMRPRQARWLVDNFYAIQKQRIGTGNKIDAAQREDEPPVHMVAWFRDRYADLEKVISRIIAEWAEHVDSIPLQWAQEVKGIGPVLTAPLVFFEIEGHPTAGHYWSFAGIGDPKQEWGKGQKRPYNARLKTHMWKIADSLIKQRDTLYRELYDDRKAYEQAKNGAGDYADQAAAILKARPNHKQATTYAEGRLSEGHIDTRCRRYLAKIFLSHFHWVSYRDFHGEAPPDPYSVAFMEHSHIIPPPHYPWPEELE